jgi:hypothetical protein
MKKVLMGVLLLGLIAAVSATPAWAQGKKVVFSLNGGAMTYIGSEGSFGGALLTLSPQIDIQVTRGFVISPEAMFLTDTEFSGLVALPGVMFNYQGKGFFAGVGVVLPVSITGELGAGTLLPKLNLGYRNRHINFTLYLLTPTEALFSENLIGASLGYRF